MGPGSKILAAACVLFAGTPQGAGASAELNELMVRPSGAEGEWIELAGPGNLPLEGWSIRDATGKPRRLPGGARLSPGGYLVLAARPESLRVRFVIPDSIPVLAPEGWPVLNDHEAGPGLPADVVVLVDASGSVRDSVAYYERWLPPEEGRSLERADPAASATQAASWGWSEDAAGATPGRVNSLVAAAPPPGSEWSGPERVDPGRASAVFRYRLPDAGLLGIWLVNRDDGSVLQLQEPFDAPAVGVWVWGPGAPRPRSPGLHFVCLRWQGISARVRRCRPVWVEP